MKLEKAFVVCPECKKPTYAYIVVSRENTDTKAVAPANFCTFCGCDLRFMHQRCKECEGFTDWADVFSEDCPICSTKKRMRKVLGEEE